MTSTRPDVFEAAEKIATAVLYEGFLLYPYRKSSVKNQQRWHFGTIGAPGWSEPTSMQTQCLIEGGAQTEVDVRIRFLQGEVQQQLSFSELTPDVESETHRFSVGPTEGEVRFGWQTISEGLYRFTCRILNLSPLESPMCSTHTMLSVSRGAFVSLMDPPRELREPAANCSNQGTWPVLTGPKGERGLMLSSPIILYDYPQIAPESHGDFFDGTEIDEILTLRVLTLSDNEKEEVRAGTDQGRGILERTETLPPEAFAKMHGAIRALRNASQRNPDYRKGDRVRLHPARRADIFDIALEGKIGVIDAVECDFEDNVHLAVMLEDDPGRDLGAAAQIGHRFFFRPEEVEQA